VSYYTAPLYKRAHYGVILRALYNSLVTY